MILIITARTYRNWKSCLSSAEVMTVAKVQTRD